MINSDVLLLSSTYAWTRTSRGDRSFIKFSQLIKQVLTIPGHILTIVAVKENSLLMVTNIKAKVVKPSASSFTTYFNTKTIKDPLAEHLGGEVWLALPVGSGAYIFSCRKLKLFIMKDGIWVTTAFLTF